MKTVTQGFLLTGISIAFLSGFAPCARALGEITLSQPRVEEKAPQRYTLTASVTNATLEKREVVLRAQIEVFDALAPQGDLPVRLLRKDQTLILSPGEIRELRVDFVGEGSPPQGSLRIEPRLRIRRQRVWYY